MKSDRSISDDTTISLDCLSNIDDQVLLQKHKRDHHVVKYFRAYELRNILERSSFRNVRIYLVFRSDFSMKLARAQAGEVCGDLA